MTTQTVYQPAKRRSDWLLWWKVEPAEIQQQVSEYYGHRWTKARHVAAYCLLFSVAMTTLFINVGWMGSNAYLDAAVMLFLAAFVFRGQRWAIVAAMLLWTVEKGLGIINLVDANPSPGGWLVVTQLMWWATFMHAFWMAFRVEQERRKIASVGGAPGERSDSAARPSVVPSSPRIDGGASTVAMTQTYPSGLAAIEAKIDALSARLDGFERAGDGFTAATAAQLADPRRCLPPNPAEVDPVIDPKGGSVGRWLADPQSPPIGGEGRPNGRSTLADWIPLIIMAPFIALLVLIWAAIAHGG
jgi:hypothetical protein